MPRQYTPRVQVTCATCGAVSMRQPSWVKSRRTFCSPDCRRNWRPLPVIIEGDLARLPVVTRSGSLRAYAIIDAADAEWASQWAWRLGSNGYVARQEDSRTISLHRELLGLPRIFDGREGDHIDRVLLNCRRSNLRIVTHAGNMQNKPSCRGSSSAYRGVSWCKVTGKWLAAIRVNGELKRLGRFVSETEAAAVALEARRQLLPYSTD